MARFRAHVRTPENRKGLGRPWPMPARSWQLTRRTMSSRATGRCPKSISRRCYGAAASRGTGRIWQRIYSRLSPALCEAIDELLAGGDHRSLLFQFKQYPPEATAATVLAYLDRCDRLRSMGIDKVDLSDVSAQMVQQLAGFSDRYDVANLRRFPPLMQSRATGHWWPQRPQLPQFVYRSTRGPSASLCVNLRMAMGRDVERSSQLSFLSHTNYSMSVYWRRADLLIACARRYCMRPKSVGDTAREVM